MHLLPCHYNRKRHSPRELTVEVEFEVVQARSYRDGADLQRNIDEPLLALRKLRDLRRWATHQLDRRHVRQARRADERYAEAVTLVSVLLVELYPDQNAQRDREWEHRHLVP
jgi:hypothetical protein